MALSLDRPVPLSKLDAVNLILSARGQAPSAQLGDGSLESSQEAESALAYALLGVQTEDWSFNREESLKLDRNQDGEILLPENLLTWHLAPCSAHLVVSSRGGKLYDRKNSTFVFTEDVYIEASLALAFEDLDQPVRWYIATWAAFNYGNQATPGDPSLRPSVDQVNRARSLLVEYDNNLRSKNLRTINPHFQRIRGRR